MAKSPIQKGSNQADALQVSVSEDDDSDDSWKQKRIQSVLHKVADAKKSSPQHRRGESSDSSSSDEDTVSAGRFRSVVGTTVKRPNRSDGETSDSGDDRKRIKKTREERSKRGNTQKQSRSRSPVYKDRRSRNSRSRSRSPDYRGRRDQRDRSRSPRGRRNNYRSRDDLRTRNNYDRQEERWNQRRREEDNKGEKRKKDQSPRGGDKNSVDEVVTEPREKKKKPEPDILTTRTGGAYIPPAKLRLMQQQITDKTSTAYQRIAWEALKKSINGLINKVNVSNISLIVQELFAENIIRGRGLLARSIVQAQNASPTFTHVYAALVAIINSKFPQNGELILKRLIVNFQKSFKRNDKSLCLTSTRFIAHLVNQQVAHEVIALEILTLLLENPSDDSVEVAVAFLKESGQKLYDISPRGMHAIFDRLRSILHESQIDKRVQYMVEVMFAVRKDGFKDFPSLSEGLDLVEEAGQFTHLLTLEDQYTTEDMLNIFKHDPEYLENEEKYKTIKKDILGEESDSESGDSGDGSSSESDSDTEEKKMEIIDQTETNLVALRRTIYLTIQSSLDFEECAHKLLKMEIKPGQEKEVCLMILDCCAQQRTYEKFYGLLAQRFCQLKKEYLQNYTVVFGEQYDVCHRLETNKLRNVAKFFSHLLYTDAIPWMALSCIKLNEDDTTSSSRIFIKILFQELSEYLGLPKLNERLKDHTLQPFLEGLMPHDNPANTRFSINFFTTIGLGGLTDDLREHLKLQQKKIMEQRQPLMKSDSSDSSDSSSDDDSSSSASSSSSESSSESEEESRKRKKKKTLPKEGKKVSSKSKKEQRSSKKNKNKETEKIKKAQSKTKRKNKTPVSSSSSSSSSESDSSSSESTQEDTRTESRKRKESTERNYGINGREKGFKNHELSNKSERKEMTKRGGGDRYIGRQVDRPREETVENERNERDERRRRERIERNRNDRGDQEREVRIERGREDKCDRGRDVRIDHRREDRGVQEREDRIERDKGERSDRKKDERGRRGKGERENDRIDQESNRERRVERIEKGKETGRRGDSDTSWMDKLVEKGREEETNRWMDNIVEKGKENDKNRWMDEIVEKGRDKRGNQQRDERNDRRISRGKNDRKREEMVVSEEDESNSRGKDERNSRGRDERSKRDERNGRKRDESNSRGRDERSSRGRDERSSRGSDERGSRGRDESNIRGRDESNTRERDTRNNRGRDERSKKGRDETNSRERVERNSRERNERYNGGKNERNSRDESYSRTRDKRDDRNNIGRDLPNYGGRDERNIRGRDKRNCSEIDETIIRGQNEVVKKGKDGWVNIERDIENEMIYKTRDGNKEDKEKINRETRKNHARKKLKDESGSSSSGSSSSGSSSSGSSDSESSSSDSSGSESSGSESSESDSSGSDSSESDNSEPNSSGSDSSESSSSVSDPKTRKSAYIDKRELKRTPEKTDHNTDRRKQDKLDERERLKARGRRY
ncbi:uncharacterized protein [Antedon mediterranea]|uniref:uncharacterized protein n=1 Tax=Antedon mediterranea TaxID=105859 RepID=UPI003AF7FE17